MNQPTLNYPGEKLLDPKSYDFDEYLVIGLAVYIIFVIIKHLIYHTLYFWWYCHARFYIPNKFWSLISGKTLTQRLKKYISGSVNGNNISIETLMNLMDDYFKNKEFAPSLSSVKGEIVDDIVIEYQPKEVLIVGCHVGYVLLQILKSLPQNSRIFITESNSDFFAFSKLLLEIVKDEHKVVFLSEELNKTSLSQLKNDYGVDKLDFVFLNRTKHGLPSHISLVKLLEGDAGHRYFHSCSAENGPKSVILADKVVLLGDPEFLKYVRCSDKYETKYYQMALEHSCDEIIDGMEKAIYVGK